MEQPTFDLDVGRAAVVLLTEEGRVLEGLHDDGLELAGGVDHADPPGVQVGVWLEEQGVLVDEHPHGDPRHVEPVEEVLDGHVGLVVHLVGLLELEHALRHGLHHVGVPCLDALEGLAEGEEGGPAGVGVLEGHQVPEALTVPVLEKRSKLRFNKRSFYLKYCDRGHLQEVGGQEVDLLHNVGEPHRQLLLEEGEGLLL